MAPCTACCPSTEHKTLSLGFAGTARIMYVGSKYRSVIGTNIFLKNMWNCSFNHVPTSANFLLPPASVSPELLMRVSPQPSATTITALPLVRIKCRACVNNLGKDNCISGSRQTSTCLAARVASMAMKPQCRPISFTKLMQFVLHVASVSAASMAFFASMLAVLKPKDLSRIGMSLSMVFGTPTTAAPCPIACMLLKISIAPRWVPSPPSTKQ
mmetsp:Transcript_107750/g.187004  ORF Transcript_107750/g.187004 Transcript_107750/m.187004 type:complete len:213 (+) Transcript_107750:3769-4407(+)